MLHAQIHQLLLNDKLADAVAYLREDIKKTYHHFEDATVAKLVAERDLSELELERSSPGLFNAMTQRLGQADATLLRRAVALVADKKSATDDELKAGMSERARAMKYGPMPRDYIAALRDGREPGDLIALELMASLLHLRVLLLREDGSIEKDALQGAGRGAAPAAGGRHLLHAHRARPTPRGRQAGHTARQRAEATAGLRVAAGGQADGGRGGWLRLVPCQGDHRSG